MANYAGADHLEACGTKLSDFGREVADLLGDLYRGIYHINGSALTHKRTNWAHESRIEIVLHGSMATFDGAELTRLVVLCHDRCIRCELCAASNGYLRLFFSKRKGREGNIYERHPTLETHVSGIREDIKRGD